jgi:hypothetical protein
MGSATAEGIATAPALLFGRRTYEDFFAIWPGRTDQAAALKAVGVARPGG